MMRDEDPKEAQSRAALFTLIGLANTLSGLENQLTQLTNRLKYDGKNQQVHEDAAKRIQVQLAAAKEVYDDVFKQFQQECKKDSQLQYNDSASFAMYILMCKHLNAGDFFVPQGGGKTHDSLSPRAIQRLDEAIKYVKDLAIKEHKIEKKHISECKVVSDLEARLRYMRADIVKDLIFGGHKFPKSDLKKLLNNIMEKYYKNHSPTSGDRNCFYDAIKENLGGNNGKRYSDAERVEILKMLTKHEMFAPQRVKVEGRLFKQKEEPSYELQQIQRDLEKLEKPTEKKANTKTR